MLTHEEEKSRYQSHDNNVEDLAYRNYLHKLTVPLFNLLKSHDFGAHLDFGSGKAPVVSEFFVEKKWLSDFYDCYFYPEKPEKQYEVVTAIEVVEHFREPEKNWEELLAYIKLQGLLMVNTQIYVAEEDEEKDRQKFHQWWYKNDPTHVGIYSERTLRELEEKLGLQRIYFDHIKTIIWRKHS